MYCTTLFHFYIESFICILLIFVYKFQCIGEFFSTLHKLIWQNKKAHQHIQTYTHKWAKYIWNFICKCGRVSFTTCTIFFNFLSMPLVVLGSVKIAQFSKFMSTSFSISCRWNISTIQTWAGWSLWLYSK